MLGQVSTLVLLFGLIFGLNVIPGFAPPTWMAVAFIGFEFPGTNTVLLALVAATAATLGRTWKWERPRPRLEAHRLAIRERSDKGVAED